MPGYEFIGKEEKAEVDKVFDESGGVLYRYGFDKLRTRYFVKEFEQEFAKKLNVPYSLAVCSGSAALKISLQALGVGPGDEVITQAHTFIATVEAICEVGATPVICDIDFSLNMDPSSLAKLITPKTKVVIPVHMGGVACDMLKIHDVVQKKNPKIKILEDNAQSPGGTWNGQYLGTLGDIGIFSFDFGKILTTGEGGMIVTKNEALFKRCRSFSDHGHAENPNVPRGEDDCIGLGFNYKLTELQGAIGLAQLKKFDKILELHRDKKQKIKRGVSREISLRVIHDSEGDIGDSFTFFLPDKAKTKMFVEEWKKRGLPLKNLPSAKRWHFAKYWNHIHYICNGLKQSETILDSAVEIPIKAFMTDEEIKKIIASINEIYFDVVKEK
jgi:8-amino-3,8-dideoxy-alpha-D-manno-octulosonate transaminase